MEIEQYVSITKALSDNNRIRALLALQQGELCVCQIIELLKLAPSTVSKHMSILKQAGLVKSRKDNRWVYYTIADKKVDKPIYSFIDVTIKNLMQSTVFISDSIVLSKILKTNIDTLCCLQNKKGAKI